jgi:hypothetical protein
MGMRKEIEAALKAHAAWREHFNDILHGRTAFELKEVGSSDHCELGRWLINEGYRMIPTSLHDEICEVHSEFHRIAAEILQKIREKRYAEAKQDIELDGAFNQTSKRLRSLLTQLSFKEPAPTSANLDENAAEGEQMPQDALPGDDTP